MEYLIVGGGGGGGNGYHRAGGGGGAAGMMLSGTLVVTPGTTYTVIVGDGGVGGADTEANNQGTAGEDSVFATVTALGGIGGQGSRTTTPTARYSGGAAQFGSDTSAQPGGGGGGGGSGGGGGGATGAGGNGSGTTGGAGGAGLASDITGSGVTYAVGGAGGGYDTDTDGADGTNNRGNGGGAGGSRSSSSAKGGDGGAGIVVIKYTSNSFRIDAADPSTFSGIVDLNGGLTIETQSGNTFFNFDGSTGYIDTNVQYDNTTSFTIAAWIRQDESATGNRAIFSDEPPDANNWDHRLMLSNKSVYADIRGTTTGSTPLRSLPVGWNYVVTTLSDSKLKLYINGFLASEATYSGVSTNNQEIWIGRSAYGGYP